MKMTFTCEHYDWDDFTGKQKEPISKITFETKSVALSDIVTDFESFLRGCGFGFDGVLDIVDPDPVIGCGDCESCECETGTTNTSNWAWNSIVHSLNNPPSFRAADLTGKNS